MITSYTSAYLAVIITVVMASCYYLGYFLSTRNALDSIVPAMLDLLEREGFIITELDEDGDKDLVPVSSVIAEALRDVNP